MLFMLSFIACLVALAAARLAIPVERERALPCAVMFLLNWLWYASAWLAHSPAVILHGMFGADIQAWELWAAGDAITGFYIFTKAVDVQGVDVKPWGLGLFMLFVLQEFIHLWLGEASVSNMGLFAVYGSLLNATFALQVLCLMLSGGTGVRMRLTDAYVRWRSWLGAHSHKAVRATDEEAR